MIKVPWHNSFLWRWIVANSLGELLGLGTVAVSGFVVASRLGEPHGLWQSLALSAFFILLGAFEGLVVGLAQARVLKLRLPGLKGWTQATVVGAIVAWTLGMAPSTMMSLISPEASEVPPEISEAMQLLFAALLGSISGPILAFFQWRCLRHYVNHAGWWLPANGLAWALAMPLLFAGAHLVVFSSNPVFVVLVGGVDILVAGAVVGLVHGRVLVWLLDVSALHNTIDGHSVMPR